MSDTITSGEKLSSFPFVDDPKNLEVYGIKDRKDYRVIVGQAGGLATLDPDTGKVHDQQLPSDVILAPARIDAANQRIQVLEESQDSNQIAFKLWTELAAVPATSIGQMGQVIGDSGTHVDPVSGLTVSNSGQYRATGAAWQWLRADTISMKADKSEVAVLAGTISPAVVDGHLEVHTGPDDSVSFALHKDGTYEFLATKVGDHRVTKGGDGTAVATGKISVGGVYTQFDADISDQFPGAMMIDVDSFGRVGKITYADGREVFPGLAAVELHRMQMLPDGASGQNPNGGFTCTGLALITTGPWTNCWLVANDGRTIEGSTVYLCSIIILAPDFSRVLREFTVYDKVSPAGSLQGVAWDESDNTIWFADQGSNLVRHMDLTGALLPDTINTGFIPNAVARIAAEDALILPRYNTSTVDIYSCATGALIRSVDGIRTDHDQACFEPAKNLLWYTAGPNGGDGSAYSIDMSTGAAKSSYLLPGSQSIEGIHKDGSTITVLNDGAFHTVAKPPLALVCTYKINN